MLPGMHEKTHVLGYCSATYLVSLVILSMTHSYDRAARKARLVFLKSSMYAVQDAALDAGSAAGRCRGRADCCTKQ